jgi:1-acyl-sn-glycerol-3-phosphate acyltransferase
MDEMARDQAALRSGRGGVAQMIRSCLFVIWAVGSMVLLGILYLPAILFSRRWVIGGIRLWANGLRWGVKFFAGIQTDIRGAENLPSGPLIYASKHQCMYDTLLPFIVLSDPAVILKKELLWYPVFGWYALRGGMIPIDRAGNIKTLKAMIRKARQRSEDGRQIIIYPEGTRRLPGAPGDYKIGVFALYNDLQVPCVPVATNAGLFWPGKGIRLKPGRVVIEILTPLPTGLKRGEFMDRLETSIETACQPLFEEGLALLGKTVDHSQGTTS